MSFRDKDISVDARKMLEKADESPAAFLRIKQSYSFDGSNEIIIVVEGADDEVFYSRLVKQIIDIDSLEIARAGSKKQVYETYHALDWALYKRERILFFVDRDYDEVVSEVVHEHAFNIYVTDRYAIENYIFGEDSFLGLCSYACGRDVLSKDDELFIRKLYSAAFSVFEVALSNVPETLVAWRKAGLRPNQGNIKLKEMVKVDKGIATQNVSDVITLIANQCGIPENMACVSDRELQAVGERLHCYGDFCSKMSGKIVMQFFKMLTASMVNYRFPSGAKISKNQTLNSDLFPICVSFTDCPRSLRDFLLGIKQRLQRIRGS